MATNTIGKLSVVLTARTAGFQSAMKKAGETVARLSKAVGVGALAIGAMGAAAIAAAAGGLAMLTKQQLSATDALAKSSDRIGITTEALAGLEHAAGLAGVESETLRSSLMKMNRTIGDSINGLPAASRAFDRLGLSAASLSRMRSEDAMALIADRINGLGTQAEKTAAAMEIFGRQGVMLMTLFQSGGDGIRSASREAERLGLSVSRIDAAKIEAANDAMTRARTVFQGIGRQLAVAVAPAIEAVASRFVKLAESGGGVGVTVRASVMVALSAIAALADGWDSFMLGVKASGAVFLDFKATALEAIASVTSGLQKFAAMLPGPVAAPVLALAPGVSGMATTGAQIARKEARGIIAGMAESGFGDRIRGFASGLFDQDGTRIANAQQDTTEAIHDLTAEVKRQTDVLRDALGRATPGDQASLIRVLDRLAIGITSPNTRSLVGAT